MTSETYIDFCFVRPQQGNFTAVIDDLLKSLFANKKLNWYLEEKTIEQADMVVAEIKGMSNWSSEDEAVQFIEENAEDEFWKYLQGYKMFIYPVLRGCNSCGGH